MPVEVAHVAKLVAHAHGAADRAVQVDIGTPVVVENSVLNSAATACQPVGHVVDVVLVVVRGAELGADENDRIVEDRATVRVRPSGVVDIQYCEVTFGLEVFGGYFCQSSPELGTYLDVRFSVGSGEGGSSGSGAFANSTNRLVGTLTGGTASCSKPEGSINYGRFDIAYRNKLNQWLGVTDACDAEPGSWAYCSNPACGPCDRGQGDCDSNDECKEGLVCARDAGEKYGFPTTTDVCELPEEAPPEGACVRNPGGWEFCADPKCGPCAEGGGDCDADIECAADLVPERYRCCPRLRCCGGHLRSGAYGFLPAYQR